MIEQIQMFRAVPFFTLMNIFLIRIWTDSLQVLYSILSGARNRLKRCLQVSLQVLPTLLVLSKIPNLKYISDKKVGNCGCFAPNSKSIYPQFKVVSPPTQIHLNCAWQSSVVTVLFTVSMSKFVYFKMICLPVTRYHWLYIWLDL